MGTRALGVVIAIFDALLAVGCEGNRSNRGSSDGSANDALDAPPQDGTGDGSTDAAADAVDASTAPDVGMDLRVDADSGYDRQPDGDVNDAHADARPDGDAASDAAPAVGACSNLFDQAVLATYDVTISAADWAALRDEFLNFEARQAAGLPLHPYHPIRLQYGNESLDAWIRLKGRSSWFNSVRSHGEAAKMQFVIAFDQGADSKRRFHGVQKVELDHAVSVDGTYLHERLSTWYLRKAGLPAACVNNVRLAFNGAYYGLYSHLEHPNRDFLKRVFPGQSSGDLWHKRSELETSQGAANYARHDQIWATTTASQMAALTDMTTSLRIWAAEAMLTDRDGYWGGNNNFFMYDHPTRGWMWLPDDLDGTLDFMPADSTPLFFWVGRVDRNPGIHYSAVLADPVWRGHFLDAIAWATARWDVNAMQALVDTWSDQIASAAQADPNVLYTYDSHRSRVQALRAHVAERAAAMSAWTQCVGKGGTDLDNDGVPWCLDCDELDPATHLGAVEICGDARDQNCNGVPDDGC